MSSILNLKRNLDIADICSQGNEGTEFVVMFLEPSEGTPTLYVTPATDMPAAVTLTKQATTLIDIQDVSPSQVNWYYNGFGVHVTVILCNQEFAKS